MASLTLSWADISNDGPTDVILLVARTQPPTQMLIEKMVAEAIKMIGKHKTPTIRIILYVNHDKLAIVDQMVRDAIGSHKIPYLIDCTDNIYDSVMNALDEYKWGVWFAETDNVDGYKKMMKSINAYFFKAGKASAMIDIRENSEITNKTLKPIANMLSQA